MTDTPKESFSETPENRASFSMPEADSTLPNDTINAASDGIRGRTLTNIRWLTLAGQTVFILILALVFGFRMPVDIILGIQIGAILVNTIVVFRYDGESRISDATATGQLAFDLTHLSVLLFVTGGLSNPFCLLILAPTTVSAFILPRFFVRLLVSIAVVEVTILPFTPYTLPWNGIAPVTPPLLEAGIWSALVLTLVFLTAYVARVGREARRRTVALAASQLALEKEQRLSALGAQAAAAAHELGTPLGSLLLILQDRIDAGNDTTGLLEDLKVMKEEVTRCRSILYQLRDPESSGQAGHFDVVAVEALLREAAAPHEARGASFSYINMITDDHMPQVLRRPAVLHALRNIMENAAGFAVTKVTVSFNSLETNSNRVQILVDDDGPGFDSQIARQIGEPYVTNRRPQPGHDGGLGLGLFIAITLLEREDCSLRVSKNPSGGARVKIELPIYTV